MRRSIKNLQNFAKTLFFIYLFSSCSTGASLDMGSLVQQIFGKSKRQNWEKSLPKKKLTRIKALSFW